MSESIGAQGNAIDNLMCAYNYPHHSDSTLCPPNPVFICRLARHRVQLRRWGRRPSVRGALLGQGWQPHVRLEQGGYLNLLHGRLQHQTSPTEVA